MKRQRGAVRRSQENSLMDWMARLWVALKPAERQAGIDMMCL